MFFKKGEIFVLFLLFNLFLNAQQHENPGSVRDEMIPMVIGVSTQDNATFMKIVNDLCKNEGVYVQKWCSAHQVIELVIDTKFYFTERDFISFLEKKYNQARFFLKEYTPIEKVSGCQDVVKSSF